MAANVLFLNRQIGQTAHWLGPIILWVGSWVGPSVLGATSRRALKGDGRKIAPTQLIKKIIGARPARAHPGSSPARFGWGLGHNSYNKSK